MIHTVTLIANPDHQPLRNDLVVRMAAAVDARAVDWLADGEACALVVDAEDKMALAAKLGPVLGGQPIDMCVQAGQGAALRRRILIADMDSTMIEQECIDELAAEAGLKEQVSAITARAMNGELEFEGALKERVALLEGLPASVIDKVISTRISLMAGGPELVRTMRRDGAWCALVSGGFTDFTSRIAEMLGFHENRANTLLQSDGKLSGKVAEPILGRDAKVQALKDISARLDIDVADAIAVGDGANDLGMIQLAGTGVALHAKPVVAEQADIRIDYGNLTALLYIQGYHASEFSR